MRQFLRPVSIRRQHITRAIGHKLRFHSFLDELIAITQQHVIHGKHFKIEQDKLLIVCAVNDLNHTPAIGIHTAGGIRHPVID